MQVYIRPAESYRTGQLEFHCMAVFPSQEDELLVLQQSDALASITLAEEIIKQEVCFHGRAQSPRQDIVIIK